MSDCVNCEGPNEEDGQSILIPPGTPVSPLEHARKEALGEYLNAREEYEKLVNINTTVSAQVNAASVPKYKEQIIAHLNLQINELKSKAQVYATLRKLIEKMPDEEDDDGWKVLWNTVVRGQITDMDYGAAATLEPLMIPLSTDDPGAFDPNNYNIQVQNVPFP